MPLRLFTMSILSVAALTFTGCTAKLNESKTYNLETQAAECMILPPQSKAQKLTITVESAQPVDVFIADGKKVNSGKLDDFTSLPLAKQKDTSITSKTDATKETITADIPANTETLVILANAKKKTEVKLNVTNQK